MNGERYKERFQVTINSNFTEIFRDALEMINDLHLTICLFLSVYYLFSYSIASLSDHSPPISIHIKFIAIQNISSALFASVRISEMGITFATSLNLFTWFSCISKHGANFQVACVIFRQAARKRSSYRIYSTGWNTR